MDLVLLILIMAMTSIIFLLYILDLETVYEVEEFVGVEKDSSIEKLYDILFIFFKPNPLSHKLLPSLKSSELIF